MNVSPRLKYIRNKMAMNIYLPVIAFKTQNKQISRTETES